MAAPAPGLSNREFFPYYSSTIGDGPNGTWPPLLAIRDRQYKLHLFTKGGTRPATGRADWTYRDAAVCTAPLKSWVAEPLLFDLFKGTLVLHLLQ